MFSISPHGLLPNWVEIFPIFSKCNIYFQSYNITYIRTKYKWYRQHSWNLECARINFWNYKNTTLGYFLWFWYLLCALQFKPNKCSHQVQSKGNLHALEVSLLQESEIYADVEIWHLALVGGNFSPNICRLLFLVFNLKLEYKL